MCTTDDEVCRLRNMFCKIKYIVFKIKIAFIISPDDYDITVNQKENSNVLLLLMFHISRKQPPASVR